MAWYDFLKGRTDKLIIDVKYRNRFLEALGFKFDYYNYRKISLENIALATIFSHTCDIFSRAKYMVIDKDGKEVENHPLIERLKNPNYNQTQSDFTYQHLWYKMLGANYIYESSNASQPDVNRTQALYNLYFQDIDFSKIQVWNDFIITDSQKKTFSDTPIYYELNGNQKTIPVSKVIPFYDISNTMDYQEWMESPSRMRAAIPVIEAIETNLRSKKNALSFSDKYLVSNKSQFQGMPKSMTTDDKKDIEDNVKRKEIMATNADVTVTNLAPDFRKLLLDDLFAHDVLKLAMLWGMNKDVLNYFAQGSTFENQEKAFINWLQSKIQAEVNNFAEGLGSHFRLEEQGQTLIGTLDHLPAMQRYRTSQTEGFKTLVDAMTNASQNGLIDAEQAKIVVERYKDLL